MLLLTGYLVVFWRGLRIFWLAQDQFGRYLALGCVTVLTVQALFNMSVVLSLAPTKGIPLPLISYGGSFALVLMFSLGLEFHFRRLIRAGWTVVIIAVLETSFMIWLGHEAGRLLEAARAQAIDHAWAEVLDEHVGPAHQRFQPRFVDRNAAFVERADLAFVHVQAHHVVAHFGQAGACDQTDIAGADDAKFHGSSVGMARKKKSLSAPRPPLKAAAGA